MKSLIILFVSLLLLTKCRVSDHPGIYVKDVSNPVISLNGTWKICLSPSEKFMDINQSGEDWKDIQVPGECMMQGFPIEHNKPFVYKKEFTIPADYKGKTIKVRFEGVYSYARIWVNGKYICEHSGGFTAWECDITSVVIPGQTSVLTAEVIDKADEISFASGYAKHPIGGILRDVSLLALPHNYPEQLFVITDLDENYRDAVLTIEGKVRKTGKKNRIDLEVFDVMNKKVDLQVASTMIPDTFFRIKNLFVNPLKWNAEHPNLYQLKVSFVEDGKLTWYKYYTIGFRKIEISGNRFLVNGSQVKMRGACRHDIHPLLGRVSTPEYEIKDILLAKEANINFIRTSHYPPTESFLKLCDEYGIYVEDEAAVCFVNSNRSDEYFPGASESSQDFTDRYMSQLKEMVYNHRNHPSVMFWSIGNENSFGTNFKKSYDWIKVNDPSRPVIFSYPGNVPDSIKSYDLLSMHYPETDGRMEYLGKATKAFGYASMPVIFDEWAHVPCYNSITLMEDPNIRDFWGITLDSMWQRTYDSDGGLGGAIWGMIDETFMLPSNLQANNDEIEKNDLKAGFKEGKTVGYGEWGIIDTWRRKKPEFWSVKKAYSPVRILETEYDFKPGNAIIVSVYNRFDFTNISELKIKYTIKGLVQTINSPDIPAHTKGTMLIPLEEWSVNEPLLIDFFDADNHLLDSYTLHRSGWNQTQTAVNTSYNISLTEDNIQFIIACENNLKMTIDKSTGLFTGFETSSGKFAFSGPCLNLRTKGDEIVYSSHQVKDYGIGWKLKTLSVQKKENTVEVSIKGDYTDLPDIVFGLRIFADGSIETDYAISEPPKEYIREIGITYSFDDIFDTLSWQREPYWSAYPEGHLSAPVGSISLESNNHITYRKAPENEWQYDSKSFFYDGLKNEKTRQLSYVAKSTKENIRKYTLNMKGTGSIIVTGNSTEGCRIDMSENNINLYINNQLDYPDIGWGNYQRNIIPAENYIGRTEVRICAKI